MKDIFTLMRPHQYVKNLFIFAPLFFVGDITNIGFLGNSLIAFVAFSIAASGIYVFNDLVDIESDRAHPKKKSRPLASGVVSKKIAYVLIAVCPTIGVIILLSLSLQTASVLAIYILLNIAYTLKLKHIAILDVAIIAIGFVLRLFVGSSIANIELSHWIVIMTFLLALLLALGKRRDDVEIFLSTGNKMRRSMEGYNLGLIDASMSIMAAVVIVSYILYTTSTQVITRLDSNYLYLTALFVLLGILRYLQIVFVEKNSGSPTKIAIKDTFIKLTIFCWVASFAWIIYL